MVIGSFGVFGHFVSFEIKCLVIGSFSVLVNPLNPFEATQSAAPQSATASLQQQSLQDSQHMLTPPNRLWMVDPAC